jgi:hypothetical protein
MNHINYMMIQNSTIFYDIELRNNNTCTTETIKMQSALTNQI